MKKNLKSFVLAGFFVLASALVAHAIPLTLTIDDLSTDGVIDETVTSDTGVINFNDTIGDFTVVVATGVTAPLAGSPTLPELHLDSIQVSGSNAGTLVFTLLGTGYGPLDPSFDGFLTELNANASGSMSVVAKINGAVVADFGTFTGKKLGDVFTDVAPPGTFDMEIIATVTHTEGYQVSNFGVDITPVPEPGTLILVGSGLIGLVYLKRRKKA